VKPYMLEIQHILYICKFKNHLQQIDQVVMIKTLMINLYWGTEHVKIDSTFRIFKNRWRILKNLNVDVKRATLIITTCCILHGFCFINHDICHSGIVGMQDLHPNFIVNKRIPTQITSETERA
jgi:hypothetical protein